MKLREKKKIIAKQLLCLLHKHSLIDSVGGIDGVYISKLNKMVAGENVRYDREMNWLKIDFLYQYPDVAKKIEELSKVDIKISLIGWLPWI